MAKGKQAGFLEFQREVPAYRDIQVRIGDFMSVEAPLGEAALNRQVQRCMDCGVPFCHAYGCPVGNRVPDYCDELALGNWKRALELLHSTNNFPEFTGRICPALCEASCTLSLHDEPTICRHIEMQIAERGWKEGWIQPVYPEKKTDKRVAIVGSGPSGLAAAQQLVRMGHEVVVFEQSDRIGGLLRYGIPNFKLEKMIIDRRLDQMVQEGVRFETETVVGVDLSARYLLKNYDAVLLALGTSKARDLPVPGRELRGIHPAMELLTQQTRLLSGDPIDPDTLIDPAGKDVVVIGGGDTGADCVGTVLRRGARSVVQVELLDAPPQVRPAGNPWPEWPRILRTSSSHDEGCRRLWSVLTREFIGSEQVEGISCTEIQWEDRTFKEIPGSAFQLDAQLVLLSMGFSPDADSPVVKDFALATDDRGAVAVDERYHTSKERVFATGDVVTGASLVVRSIDHGRRCAEHLHRYLMD